MLGYPIMDPLAGGVVAVLIARAGYGILATGVRDLMDTSLSEKKVKEIAKQIEQTPGVLQCHDLRTRRIGGEIIMDAHILVDKELSVSEGHNIAEMVRRDLIKTWDNIHDILIHVDAEDDSNLETIYPTSSEELKKLTDPIIASTAGVLERTNLRVHFINGRAVIEVFIRMEESLSMNKIKTIVWGLTARLQDIENVDEARIFLNVNDSEKPGR